VKAECIELYLFCRFHNAAEEIVVGRDIVPPVSDSVQLTVDEYRNKLYEVCINCAQCKCLRFAVWRDIFSAIVRMVNIIMLQ